ncbi:MAG: amidohydrolase [Nitrospirota bacterium]
MSKKFYDIHFHAFNLSHPDILAFIKRFGIEKALFLGSMAPLAAILLKHKIDDYKNLISLMEHDLGSYFLIVEEILAQNKNCQIIKNEKAIIGGHDYDKIVLTPLMMDFGYKGLKDKGILYELKKKPIAEQVIDLFNGIRDYKNNSKTNIFEIFPFMGINTANYTIDELLELLEKYFKDYTGKENDLLENMGKFDGNIDNIKSNFFAGIKVYPPLGFDPWPEDNEEERFKVKLLYSCCVEKQIPITSHCSDGGFLVIDKERHELIGSPERWERVLTYDGGRYKNLKLNLAHFGWKSSGYVATDWAKKIVDLILRFNNVYTDIAYRGVDDDYYQMLRNFIDSYKDDALIKKLEDRILFGSDFMINLRDIDSYNDYLCKFSKAKQISSIRDKMCQDNPRRFLNK